MLCFIALFGELVCRSGPVSTSTVSTQLIYIALKPYSELITMESLATGHGKPNGNSNGENAQNHDLLR